MLIKEEDTGYTALMYSVLIKNRELFDELLDSKSDAINFNRSDHQGNTAISFADPEMRKDILQCWLESAADNEEDDNVEFIIENWSDINTDDALEYLIDDHHGCHNFNEKIIRLLVKRLSDTGPILMLAAQKGYVDLVNILIDEGADVNKRDKNGKSALFLTTNPEIIESLLVAGANIIMRMDEKVVRVQSYQNEMRSKFDVIINYVEDLGKRIRASNNITVEILEKFTDEVREKGHERYLKSIFNSCEPLVWVAINHQNFPVLDYLKFHRYIDKSSVLTGKNLESLLDEMRDNHEGKEKLYETLLQMVSQPKRLEVKETLIEKTSFPKDIIGKIEEYYDRTNQKENEEFETPFNKDVKQKGEKKLGSNIDEQQEEKKKIGGIEKDKNEDDSIGYVRRGFRVKASRNLYSDFINKGRDGIG